MSALILACASQGAIALALESPWLDGYKSRTRLSAGVTEAGDRSRLHAFVEIELPAGWKTYWRSPGDAGGLPPTFDWSKSSNLASATVLFPAPKLMTDKAGNTFGYKDSVVFPVEIRPENADEAISLALTLQFGICKDICVPAEAELSLEIPPKVGASAPAAGLEALEHVPRGDGERRSGDPALKRAVARLDGAKPQLTLEASFAGDPAGAVIFLEAPDGLYLPLPTLAKDNGGGVLTFEADLSRDVDLAALRGKTITATLVSPSGASVSSFKIE
jgi:DsbC/DsbD-like thiol-disulfide interchange protein